MQLLYHLGEFKLCNDELNQFLGFKSCQFFVDDGLKLNFEDGLKLKTEDGLKFNPEDGMKLKTEDGKEIRTSLVPFEIRFLSAFLPSNLNFFEESTRKLFQLKMEVEKLEKIQNENSKNVWQNRKCEILAAIGSNFVQIREFGSAIKIYEQLAEFLPLQKKSQIFSLIGKIFLQLGEISRAQIWFSKGNPDPFVTRINKANLAIFMNNYCRNEKIFKIEKI